LYLSRFAGGSPFAEAPEDTSLETYEKSGLAVRLPNDFFRLPIGAEPSGDGAINATRGLIDEFAVFGNFLTPEEIGRLADGESPKAVSIPSAPFVITRVVYATGTGLVTVTWNTILGASHAVDYSPDLSDGSWQELDDSILGTGEQVSFPDPTARLGGSGYYRVRRL
jgi:hypothetical protein